MKQQVLSMFKNKISDNRIIFLSILFLMLLLLFTYFVYQSTSLNYLPIFSDEYGYYLDAKSFWLYNRIDAPLTLNESYSLIGHAGFHGIMYSVFYGSFFKLLAFLGIDPSITLVNMVLVFFLFGFLAYSRMDLENKLLIGIVFLSNFIFIIYISSSMSEIFHYSFAVVVGYLLHLVYKTRENKYLYLLIGLIFFLIFFRESWVFVFFGLFPLAKSFKDIVKYSIVLLIGLVVVILYQKYFQAAYVIDYFHNLKLQLDSGSLIDVLHSVYDRFLINLNKYFATEAYERYRFVFYYKYLFAVVLLYALYASFRTRSRTILSGAIIAFVFFSSLLVLYDPFGWREVRVLAAPFILLTVILILNKKHFAVYMIILFQLLTINAVINTKQNVDLMRQKMNLHIKESQALLDDFSEFGKYLDFFEKKRVVVLMDWNLIPVDNSAMIYQLPLFLNGKNISYSFIYRHFDIMDSICDLYISNKEENNSNMKLIGNNQNFYFYRRVH